MASTGFVTSDCRALTASVMNPAQAACAEGDHRLPLCLVRVMLWDESLQSSPHQAALLEDLVALLAHWQQLGQQASQVCWHSSRAAHGSGR